MGGFEERQGEGRGVLVHEALVADLATARAIEDAGGGIEVPIHTAPSHPVKALVARDPEGHMIEVIQMLGER